MWMILISVATAGATQCPLGVVQPREALAIQSPMQIGDLLRAVPRGSLVRQRPDDRCGDGTGIEVISVVYFYTQSGIEQVKPGERGCISGENLVKVEDFVFMNPPLPPDSTGSVLESGEVLGRLQDGGSCNADRLTFEERSIPLADLSWIRALSPELLSQSLEIQDRWLNRYGPVMMGRIWLSDWGYLSVPMLRYRDSAQLEAEWARESLESQAQRERAVSAVGPGDLWLHFLGADTAFSDTWGQPDAVESLTELAQSWMYWCTGTGLADREACTLQIGDMAWYNSVQPDPLGHRTHSAGRCVDLRLFRLDGSRYESYWNQPDDRPDRPLGYSRDLTQAFVDFVHQHLNPAVFYFNDPSVLGVEPSHGHDDHLHLCFEPVIGEDDE